MYLPTLLGDKTPSSGILSTKEYTNMCNININILQYEMY